VVRGHIHVPERVPPERTAEWKWLLVVVVLSVVLYLILRYAFRVSPFIFGG
jgi:uncharacterized BrkB/YihY/UPF0761 family membrane protein